MKFADVFNPPSAPPAGVLFSAEPLMWVPLILQVICTLGVLALVAISLVALMRRPRGVASVAVDRSETGLN